MSNNTPMSFVLDPDTYGHPPLEVTQEKVAELLGRGQATREDPYGEFADIVPVTIRNAGLLLRQARAALDEATRAYLLADAARATASNDRTAAQEEVNRAEHRLKISALQPNGGEE